MNGFDLKEMTSWKKENDMCVYVDNSVDLVDFSCFSTKKATSVSNLSTEKKMQEQVHSTESVNGGSNRKNRRNWNVEPWRTKCSGAGRVM